MNYALVAVGSFLLGGIPFGYIITRLYGGGDIRAHGSGNIGATNVWRVMGAVPGVITLALDFGKGLFAVLYVSEAFEALYLPTDHQVWLPLCAGVSAILGHVYTPYLNFRGGKGVVTAFGVLIALMPEASLIGLIVFALVVSVSRYISLGSILGALALAGSIWYQYFSGDSPPHQVYLYFSTAIAVLIVFTHRQNIRRLLNGEENRFSLKKKRSQL